MLVQGSASVLDLLVTESLMSVSGKQGLSPWSPKEILLLQTVVAASHIMLSLKTSGATSRNVVQGRVEGFTSSGPSCWSGDANIPCVHELCAWLLKHGYVTGQRGETLLSEKDMQRSI